MKCFIKIILILIVTSQLVFLTDGNAQSVESVNDNIGGGGSGSAQVNDNSDNSLLYIAGAVVVGLVVWKVISDRNSKKEIEEQDSTTSRLLMPLRSENETMASQIRRIKDILPVDIYLGINSPGYSLNERKINLGIKFKL